MTNYKHTNVVLHEIPNIFWATFEDARTEQLMYYGFSHGGAREFAKSEIKTRKRIAQEHGPEHAIFAVWERPEFPLEGRGSLALKVVYDGPFGEGPDDIDESL